MTVLHCIQFVEPPRFSDLLDEEVQNLLLDMEVVGSSSHQLVSVAGNGVDGTLDSSFPLIKFVGVFQLVVVVVEK